MDSVSKARERASAPYCRGIRLDGTRCRELRRVRGLTQEQLADAARGPGAISLATIKRAEAGAMIDLTSATALAKLLATDVTRLTPAGVTEASPSIAAGAQSSPRSLAIAVMPFEALDDAARSQPAPDYFCDGLVDDLLCRLGTFWFPVISRASTLRYRGRAVVPLEAAAELRARYVVAGTVRRRQGRVRVNVELTNAETQLLVWTGQVNGAGEDILRLQDEMSTALSSHLGGRILGDAIASAPARGEDTDAWDLSLRGAWHFYRSTPADNAAARQCLLDALRRDPRLRCAHYWLCMTHQHDVMNHWTQAPRQSLETMVECVREFRRWHPHDPYMNTAAAYAFVYTGERATAMTALENAIGAEPNIAAARSLYGQVLAMANRPDEAIIQLRSAIELSPFDPRVHAFKTGVALAHFVAGRYQESVEWSQQALVDCDDFGMAHATLACALAHGGDRAGAARSAQRMGDLASPAGNQALSVLMSSTEPEIRERFMHGLYLAGVRPQ